MKTVFSLVMVVGLMAAVMACTSDEQAALSRQQHDSSTEKAYTENMNKIDGLQGCTVHIVYGKDVYQRLTVTHCPLSITTTEQQRGKFISRTTTVSP